MNKLLISNFRKILLAIAIILVLPTTTFAETVTKTEVGVAIPGSNTTSYTFIGYLSAVFTYALKLGAILTALMVIYAGYKYITSKGNPTATGEAKEIIIGTLSGFAMLLLIYLLLNVLGFQTP